MQHNNYRQALGDLYSITHSISVNSHMRDFHIHNEYEIMFVVSEGVECIVNNTHYKIPANSLIIFNNMDLHRTIEPQDREYDRYVLYFRPEYIDYLSSKRTELLECFLYRPFADPYVVPLTDEEASHMRSLLDKAIKVKQQDENDYGYDLSVRIALVELLIYVNRHYRAHNGISNTHIDPEYQQVYTVINYIYSHLEDELSPDDIAQKLYINRRFLSQLFKKTTGLTVGEYVTKCRIMRAIDYLSKDMRIDDVCSAVGFNNLSHFSRTFKKHMGVSPKKYQIQALGEKND
ncbi:MAG: AraC family transcriptional regulator [Clostridia bacterium]|nr:AraC family transcriptional regulator [Clostridia bacterium]